jgi:hypothetical protein
MKALSKSGLAPVRGAERVTKPRHPADVMAAGASAKRDGLGTKFISDCEQSLRNLVKRLIPRNSLPSPRTACTNPAQRVFQPIRVIDEIKRDGANRTQTTMIKRRLAITFDFDQAVALNVEQHPATAMTTAAGAFEDGRCLAHDDDSVFSSSSTQATVLTSESSAPQGQRV